MLSLCVDDTQASPNASPVDLESIPTIAQLQLDKPKRASEHEPREERI